MDVKNILAVGLVIILLFIAGFAVGRFTHDPCKPKIVRDTTVDYVPYPFFVEGKSTNKKIYLKDTIYLQSNDSINLIGSIAYDLKFYDSLQTIFRNKNISIVSELDTILIPPKDTVRVTYDEINNYWTLGIKYANRKVPVTIEYYEAPRQWWDNPLVAGGIGFAGGFIMGRYIFPIEKEKLIYINPQNYQDGIKINFEVKF